MQWLLGKIFIPVAWCMGVPPSECELVGNLVALKSIVNEFAAYSKLSEYLDKKLLSVNIQHSFSIQKYFIKTIYFDDSATFGDDRHIRPVRLCQSGLHRHPNRRFVHDGAGSEIRFGRSGIPCFHLRNCGLFHDRLHRR
jgi:hypothetical protein